MTGLRRAVLVEVSALILEHRILGDRQGLVVGCALSTRCMTDSDLLASGY